jgi:DNA-binding SARP family transcriptional activator
VADVGASEREIAAAEHPLREELWHKLMLARYRSGHQAGALAAYQEARRPTRAGGGLTG